MNRQYNKRRVSERLRIDYSSENYFYVFNLFEYIIVFVRKGTISDWLLIELYIINSN